MTSGHVIAHQGSDIAAAAGKSSPAVAVSAAALAGVPLEQWAIILTIIYLVLQIAYLGWKWLRELRAKKIAADA